MIATVQTRSCFRERNLHVTKLSDRRCRQLLTIRIDHLNCSTMFASVVRRNLILVREQMKLVRGRDDTPILRKGAIMLLELEHPTDSFHAPHLCLS